MRRGPLFTLLAGGVVAAGLLAASIHAAADQNGPDDPALAGGEATPAATEPAPAESSEPEPEPDEAEVPEPVTYVGYVDGGGASVAVLVTGDEAVGYVCDGDTVEAWLTGSARNGELNLTGDGGTLTGSFDSDQASGVTNADGRDWTFTIGLVEAPEGLYRFADTVAGGAEVEGGWIVLPDGNQVGVLSVNGQNQPAPALDLATRKAKINGLDVTVERQG